MTTTRATRRRKSRPPSTKKRPSGTRRGAQRDKPLTHSITTGQKGTTAMTTPQQDTRAAWLADVRAILGAVEANPALPYPYISEKTAIFHLFRSGRPRARLTAAEAALGDALGVTFASGTEADATG